MGNAVTVTECVTLTVLVSLLIFLYPASPPAFAPYTAKMVMPPVDYDHGVTGVLVTSDGWVVLTLLFQQSIVVQSSLGVKNVPLGCIPGGVTELSSKQIAVTCATTPVVLVVSLESSDYGQIQRIPTEKQYTHVAAHPVDQTLIVASGASVDVITLQGKVVRTLVDTYQWSVTAIFSLTVTGESLLVTGAGNQQIHRMSLSDFSQSPVKTLAGSFPSWPMDTAVDKAGNVFVVLKNGGVLVKNTDGHYLQLLAGRENLKYWRCYIALLENRLLLATRIFHSGQWKSVVTEYQLVNR